MNHQWGSHKRILQCSLLNFCIFLIHSPVLQISSWCCAVLPLGWSARRIRTIWIISIIYQLSFCIIRKEGFDIIMSICLFIFVSLKEKLSNQYRFHKTWYEHNFLEANSLFNFLPTLTIQIWWISKFLMLKNTSIIELMVLKFDAVIYLWKICNFLLSKIIIQYIKTLWQKKSIFPFYGDD